LIHPQLERLTVMIREALPEGAFFDVWRQRNPKEDVYAYYFWGGEKQKQCAVPVKLIRRQHGFSVSIGTEPKERGLSRFRSVLLRLLLSDRQLIESEIGNPLDIDDVQTVVRDRTPIIIPEDEMERVVERVMLFRRVFTPYITAAIDLL